MNSSTSEAHAYVSPLKVTHIFTFVLGSRSYDTNQAGIFYRRDYSIGFLLLFYFSTFFSICLNLLTATDHINIFNKTYSFSDTNEALAVLGRSSCSLPSIYLWKVSFFWTYLLLTSFRHMTKLNRLGSHVDIPFIDIIQTYGQVKSIRQTDIHFIDIKLTSFRHNVGTLYGHVKHLSLEVSALLLSI